MGREWIEELLFIKTLRDGKVILFAGDGIQVCQALSHATVFRSEHPLHVFVTERSCIGAGPCRHFLGDIERLLVARVHIHVQHPG